MSKRSAIEPDEFDAPQAPSKCEDCGNTTFTPRSKQTTDSADTDKEYIFAYHECDECGHHHNTRSAHLFEPDNANIPDWRDIFGHPEPYEHQETGIKDIIQTSVENGYTVMEGGCGTGKTMIALTAGLYLVKHPETQFERIMILTSVKQQLRQFESDLEIINSNLPEDISPARAVTMVGKTDLCPYAREEKAGITQENVNSECRRLRDQTSKLISDGDDGVELAQQGVGYGGEWRSAGSYSPYGDVLPKKSLEYCPFYANYKGHKDPMFTFGHAPNCILDPEQIVKQAVQKGVCPHSAMGVLSRDADVVIANYFHAFDRNTLRITHPLIDENTILVCDEAHMLEPSVRGILSTNVPFYAIGKAAKEAASVYNAVGTDPITDDNIPNAPPSDVVHQLLADSGVPTELLKDTYNILSGVQNALNSSVLSYLNDNHAGWESNPGTVDNFIEVPLRDPSKTEKDSLTKWFEQQGIPEEVWEFLPNVASVVEDALVEGSRNGSTNQKIGDVAQLFEQWFARDHTRYFREITLKKNENPHPSDTGWERVFNGSVELHSVMPRATIGSRLESFGAGIVMSATLEPIDVYRQVTGLEFMSSFNDRRVTTRVYNADFPKENRLSISLDLPKYTHENRGGVSENTNTRQLYAAAIRSLARTTPGNVLVCMPSYREASWAAALLEHTDSVTKPILLDESSGEKETNKLKNRFIEGDGKVLVTSLRGTLTEGVDFDGDKCLACIVCGVPIENVGSPQTQALQNAYEDQYGDVGFQFGLTVPAVRKTRQALGRVIRNTEDIGVRVIADTRYTGGQGSVRPYLSEDEQDEYEIIGDLTEYNKKLEAFWEDKQ